MAFSTSIWAVSGARLLPVPRQRLDREQRLQEWIYADSSLLGLDLLFIGREVPTDIRGRVDLFGISATGDVVVVELKRDRTPRDVVAQALEYAAWVRHLSFDAIDNICRRHRGMSLAEAFKSRFQQELPQSVNETHQIVIVASELDDSSERIVEYLQEELSASISVVFFNVFQVNGCEVLARSWTRDPEQVAESVVPRKSAPWTGYWFVNVNHGEHGDWEDCRKYGFVSAGGGRKYSNQLHRPKIGDPIYAYVKDHGFVGVGQVTTAPTIVGAFVPEGYDGPLTSLALRQPNLRHDAGDADLADYAIGVKWHKTLSLEEAQWQKGLFANQAIACRLTHPDTLAFLRDRLGPVAPK